MKQKYAFYCSTLLIFAIFLFTFPCSSFAEEECPIEIRSKDLSTYVEITSAVDTITIYNAQINRGNFKFFPAKASDVFTKIEFPIMLNFGEILILGSWLPQGSRIKEVILETDKGNWAVTF